MEAMNKTKILIWIIVILVVINLVAVISGLIFSAERRNINTIRTDIPYNQRADFFRGELGLTPDQRKSFMNFNREFNQKARGITEKMNSLRVRMIEEMAAPDPDRVELDSICVGIGHLHTELKRATVDYYLQMKSVCDNKQQGLLNQLFERMINYGEGDRMGPGRNSPNRGPRMGRGRADQNKPIFN